ncbi:hypothetical protein chiPu_0016739 [Chiloscyllium punctatum]|uniref:Uncharacterized protein n=1 Tax=Chiloscyllium punctatum TaxID=137246 RepID=A0A401T6I7_CHIPU|nr:hypothetical protein [Chiloscyllium punctatum]
MSIQRLEFVKVLMADDIPRRPRGSESRVTLGDVGAVSLRGLSMLTLREGRRTGEEEGEEEEEGLPGLETAGKGEMGGERG